MPRELYKKYFEYFDQSQTAMAASLPSLEYCMKLINTMKLKKILDLGSGVSTLIFRSRYDDVTSVDTQHQWSVKTEEIIKDLLKEDIAITVGINSKVDESFDFVFYDYGNLEDRIYNFPKILEMDAKYIYLDDIHILPYRYYVESKIKRHRLIFLPETIDEHGRFGALLVKNEQNIS